MTAPEVRLGTEFRVSGRTLTGVAMPYGEIAPDFRERFEPGALAHSGIVDVNMQHDSGLIVAHGATLIDLPSELRVKAELPADSGAIQLIRRGALNGFSVEFHAKEERQEGGIRVISRAELTGLALVDQGAYRGAMAEVRRGLEFRAPSQTIGAGRTGYGATSRIRTDSRPKSCKCLPSESKCRKVRFKPGAFDRTVRDVRAGRRNVLAHTGSFRPENVLGDTNSGVLVLEVAPQGDLLLGLVAAIFRTLAGDALARSIEAAPPVVRPLVNDDESEFEDDTEEEVRTYSDVALDSILVKFAGDESADGWDYLMFDPEVISNEITSPVPRFEVFL